MKILIALYRGLIAYLGLALIGIIGCFLRLITFDKALHFNQRVLSPTICKAILFLIGIRLKINFTPSHEPAVYMFNHNSYLDIFLIPALGLKNTRFIISTRTKKILPLYLANLAVGSFFIPFKNEPEARLQFFKKTTDTLQINRQSAICAPEGVHVFRHGIAKFNRGIFHMTMETKHPIKLLFFAIPKASNPLESYHFQRGTVEISEIKQFETKDWTPEVLDQKIIQVRENLETAFNHYYA
jgi:1-acyl-sn-glycerol-3-phosphate acyltransferase